MEKIDTAFGINFPPLASLKWGFLFLALALFSIPAKSQSPETVEEILVFVRNFYQTTSPENRSAINNAAYQFGQELQGELSSSNLDEMESNYLRLSDEAQLNMINFYGSAGQRQINLADQYKAQGNTVEAKRLYFEGITKALFSGYLYLIMPANQISQDDQDYIDFVRLLYYRGRRG